MTKQEKIDKIRKAYGNNWINKKQLADIGFSGTAVWDLDINAILDSISVTIDGAFTRGTVNEPIPFDQFRNPDGSVVKVDFSKGSTGRKFKDTTYYKLR